MIPLLIPAALGLIGGYLSREPKKYHLGGDMSKHLAPNGKPSNLTPEQYKLVRTPQFKAWFGDWENDPENASKVVDENGEPLVVYHSSPKKFTKFKGEGHWFSNKIMKQFGKIVYQCFLNVRKPFEISLSGYSFKDGDGGYYDNLPTNINWVVKNNNQIKLADGTNTTFDANNPDIRYDGGGIIINNKKYIAEEIVEEFDISGFNNKEDAVEEIKYLLEADFPYGFNNIPEYAILYRVVLIEDGEKINEEEIGEHFISDKKMAYTLSFLEKIGVWYNWSDDSKLWLLECKTKKQNIDIEATIGNRLLYPRENEYTLKNNASVTILNKKAINKKQIDKGL
jgi:hypothetical protein